MRGQDDTMNTWRLLNLKTSSGYRNMAVDEAILSARIKGATPNTLRLYRWDPSAVSVGRFQSVENEVQLDNCRSMGVDIVRRITGGGTVYHDSGGEITYSVVASTLHLGTADISGLYARLYAGMAGALETLGVKTDFNAGTAKACPNLTVRGRKISGSAQTHKAGIVLQHGTLLLDIDFEKMFSLLRVSSAKSCSEVISVARAKMTCIKDELGEDVSARKTSEALAEGFSRALDVRLTEGELSPYESQLAEGLLKKKYAKDEWNLYGNT